MPRFTIDGSTDKAQQALFEWAERAGASTTTYDFCQECVDLYGLYEGDVMLQDMINERTASPLVPLNGEPMEFIDQYVLVGGVEHLPYDNDETRVCCCCGVILTDDDIVW